jgi:hypothetical protein
MGFGLVIGFTDNLQVITTNYYTTADFHTTNHSTLSLLSLFHQSLLGKSFPEWLFLCSVFARHFLVTNLSSGESIVCWLTFHSWTLNSTQLKSQLLLATRYTDSGWTSRKTCLLPSNGYTWTIQKTLLPLLLYLQRCCIETQVIRLLPSYSLSQECVYWVIA